MVVNIQSIHFDADDKLLDYVNKKVEKINRFFTNVHHVEIFLKLDAKNGNIHSKVAEIKVILPGKTIFAKEETLSFEDSVDAALENALQQVKKYKEKTTP